MSTPTYYWEDFDTHFKLETAPRTVTKEEIIGFASQFDPQPFHLDEEAAKQSILGGLCASGWHTCAITMRMVCDAFLLRSSSLGSPGIEHIKWLKPLYAGDTVTVLIECLEHRASASKPDIGLIKWRWTVLNQARETLMTLESWVMLGRRPAEANPASE